MIEFKITNAAKQKFSTIIGTRRVTFRLIYNHAIERWHMDLAIDGDYVLHGRKIITGVDLIDPYQFGIGRIFAYSATSAEPKKQELIDGRVKLYQVTQSEIDAALAT